MACGRLQVTVGDNTLTQVVQVANSNTADAPLKFTTALHTYFRVSDISAAHVEGLSGLKYLDNMQNRQQGTDEQDVISVDGEIDRIYVKAPDQLKVSLLLLSCWIGHKTVHAWLAQCMLQVLSCCNLLHAWCSRHTVRTVSFDCAFCMPHCALSFDCLHLLHA